MKRSMRCFRVSRLILIPSLLFLTSCDSGPEDDGNGEPINGDEPEPAWVAKTDMPTARFQHACGVFNGKIYVFGGQAGQGSASARLEVYDPSLDTWERKTDMPTPRATLSAAEVGGKIYVIGGTPEVAPQVWAALPTVEIYDPISDTWATGTDMPTARAAAGSEVDGVIYVFGGYSPDNHAYDVVEAYDPASDTWTAKKAMPAGLRGMATCDLDGDVFVMGHAQGGQEVEVYSPSTDSWTRRSDLPKGNGYFAAALLDNQMYVLGGSKPEMSGTELTVTIYSDLMVYDRSTDSWMQRTRLPRQMWGLCAAAVEGKIYAIGGSRTQPAVPLSSVYEYDPAMDLLAQ